MHERYFRKRKEIIMRGFYGGLVMLLAVLAVSVAPAAKSPKPAPAPVKPAPAAAAIPKPKDPKAANVLIVTGDDYPGHKWKLTTPVLAKAIGQDKRLHVYVVEDPMALASPDLHAYSVVVFHWMNWKKPGPGPAARENLLKFVSGGKGMVVVHFACGAFQGWDEYAKLTGRAWNPKLRGHDPRGPFRVNIVDADHPAIRGMKAFQAFDELQRQTLARADSARGVIEAWEDIAFIDYMDIEAEILQDLGREIAYDTTDAGGAVTTSLPDGTWYIHTRLSLPFSELYWNVPVDPAATDTIQLTSGNAEERIKF